MAWPNKVLRVFCGILVASFCVFHLYCILVDNLPRDARKELRGWAANMGQNAADSRRTPAESALEQALDISRGYINLTGAVQNWGMFAPNVGSLSDAPCICIYYTDGTQENLYSVTQPRLKNVEPSFNFLLRFKDLKERKAAGESDLLDVHWPLHIGDARIRKVESYVTSSPSSFGMTSVRTSYTRWRLIQHLRANPRRQGLVHSVQLFAARYEHPHFYGPAWLENVYYLGEYKPSTDRQWPKDLPAEPKR